MICAPHTLPALLVEGGGRGELFLGIPTPRTGLPWAQKLILTSRSLFRNGAWPWVPGRAGIQGCGPGRGAAPGSVVRGGILAVKALGRSASESFESFPRIFGAALAVVLEILGESRGGSAAAAENSRSRPNAS